MSRPKQPKHQARRRAQQGAKPLPTHGAPAIVSLTAAAGYLGIHASTLRRWIGSGRIKVEGEGITVDEIARVRGVRETEGK